MKTSQLLARVGKFELANKIAGTPQDIDITAFLTSKFREIENVRQKGFARTDISTPLVPGAVSYNFDGEKFIADMICPVAPGNVARKYFKFDRRNANSMADGKFAAKAAPQTIDITGSTDTYTESAYGFQEIIANADISDAADLPELLNEYAMALYSYVLKGREKRCLDLVMTAANFASGCNSALTSTARWDVGAGTSTADPLKDIRITALSAAAVGKRPNSMVIGTLAYEYLIMHPKVIAAAGARPSERLVKDDELAKLLRLDQIFVSETKYDAAANHPTTPSYGYLAPKACSLLYISPSAGKGGLTFAKTFRHHPLRFEEVEDRTKGVDGVTILKLTHADAEKIVASDAGYCLDTVIS